VSSDVNTPNPCILILEEQLALLAILKKVNVKLGRNSLPTSPNANPFGATGLSSNLRINGTLLDLATIINLITGIRINGVAPSGNVLRGNGTNFISAILAEADLSFTDITTNNISTSKHGFTPKAPNDTTKFLRGDATWSLLPTPNQFPFIASSGNAIAQTGAISSITSFTTGSGGGSFEVGGYLDVTAFTAGTISLLCDYTDPGGTARTLTIPLIALAGTVSGSVGSLTDASAIISGIQTSGANVIKIYTSVSLFTGTYNAYAWIKQIA